MKLRDVFAKILREQPERITDDLQRQSTRRWNSMRHIELVVAIETAYGISLSTAEVMSMQSFADAKQLLIGRGLEP